MNRGRPRRCAGVERQRHPAARPCRAAQPVGPRTDAGTVRCRRPFRHAGTAQPVLRCLPRPGLLQRRNPGDHHRAQLQPRHGRQLRSAPGSEFHRPRRHDHRRGDSLGPGGGPGHGHHPRRIRPGRLLLLHLLAQPDGHRSRHRSDRRRQHRHPHRRQSAHRAARPLRRRRRLPHGALRPAGQCHRSSCRGARHRPRPDHHPRRGEQQTALHLRGGGRCHRRQPGHRADRGRHHPRPDRQRPRPRQRRHHRRRPP